MAPKFCNFSTNIPQTGTLVPVKTNKSEHYSSTSNLMYNQTCEVSLDTVLFIERMNKIEDQRSTLYKVAFSTDSLLVAYELIKSKPGNLTPGQGKETLKGINFKCLRTYIRRQIQVKNDKIPQFDFMTLGAQITGLFIGFFSFYYYTVKLVIPNVLEINKLRIKKLSQNTTEKKVIIQKNKNKHLLQKKPLTFFIKGQQKRFYFSNKQHPIKLWENIVTYFNFNVNYKTTGLLYLYFGLITGVFGFLLTLYLKFAITSTFTFIIYNPKMFNIILVGHVVVTSFFSIFSILIGGFSFILLSSMLKKVKSPKLYKKTSLFSFALMVLSFCFFIASLIF